MTDLLPAPELAVRRPDAVAAALADPGLVVEPAAPAGPVGTLAWLRASVPRLREGDEHARRRTATERLLARARPAALRADAQAATGARLDAAAGRPLDAVADLARRVPVAVLAEHLGLAPAGGAERIAAAVDRIAVAWRPGADAAARGAADAAVAALLAPADGPPAERALAIGALVQACDATAGLVGLALRTALRAPRPAAPDPDALVDAVLRTAPPVRTTRRRALPGAAVPAGTTLVLDLEAASLPFGAGRHACPGEAQARALAAGVLGPLVARARPVPGGDGGDEPAGHLRLPARILVVAP